MPSPTNSCIFCGARPLTKEHAFGKWVRKFLPPRFDRTLHQTTLRKVDPKTGRYTIAESPGEFHRRGDPYSQSLQVVCHRCNNHWMSKLQTAGKKLLVPMVRGDWPELSAYEQRLVATWAIMATMVLEFSNPPTVAVPAEQREWFRLYLEPPAGWAVWLGRYDGTKRGFNHWACCVHRTSLPLPTDLPDNCNTQYTAIIFGKLILMTFSTTAPHLIEDHHALTARHGLRLIWPANASKFVMPARVHDYAGFNRLSHDFAVRNNLPFDELAATEDERVRTSSSTHETTPFAWIRPVKSDDG
jgi:hypothetical protein